MGDDFQRLAAPRVARSQAPAVAARVRAWLQQEQIIALEPSDCVLGNPAGGFQPGPGWRNAVETGSDTADGEGRLTLAVNGVEIIDAPAVHWSNWAEGPDAFAARCPGCGTRCDTAFAERCLLPHVRAWLDGDDTIRVTCPHCSQAADLPLWRMSSIALAHFGLVFWNWPPIANHFIDSLARQAGSEIFTLVGKL